MIRYLYVVVAVSLVILGGAYMYDHNERHGSYVPSSQSFGSFMQQRGGTQNRQQTLNNGMMASPQPNNALAAPVAFQQPLYQQQPINQNQTPRTFQEQQQMRQIKMQQQQQRFQQQQMQQLQRYQNRFQQPQR